MIGTTAVPRRTFMCALATSLGALLLMPCGRLVAGSGLAAAIVEAFDLPNRAMRRIGEAAIRSGCGEHATGLEIEIVSCAGVTPQEFLAASITERRHRVISAIRNDFATGRITEVDGWLLAATEVRICLLAVPRSAG